MDKLAIDTSAFLKLYLTEKGSGWLRNFIIGKEIIISQLVLFECGNTVARLSREGTLARTDASDLYTQIITEVANYTVIPLGSQLQLDKAFSLAFNLPATLRLRTLDSIHLAVAAIAKEVSSSLTPPVSFSFVSADAQLIRVARHFGFITENPERPSLKLLTTSLASVITF